MSSPPEIDKAGAWIDRFDHPKGTTYRAISKKSCISPSTIWFDKYGRRPKKKSTRDRQRLTKHEEDVLVKCFLSAAKSGHYLPCKFLPQIAQHIMRQRNSILCTPQNNLERHDVKLPGHNWGTDFLKRHPDLKHIWKKTGRSRDRRGF